MLAKEQEHLIPAVEDRVGGFRPSIAELPESTAATHFEATSRVPASAAIMLILEGDSVMLVQHPGASPVHSRADTLTGVKLGNPSPACSLIV